MAKVPKLKIDLQPEANNAEEIEIIHFPYIDTWDITVKRSDGVEVQWLKFGKKLIVYPKLPERGPE